MNRSYPNLSREQLHHVNSLLGVDYRWQQKTPDGLLWQMQLSNSLPECQAVRYLALRVDGHEIWFGFDEHLLSLCCNGLPQAGRLPTEFQLGFLSTVLEPVLSRLFSPASVSIDKQAYADIKPVEEAGVELSLLLGCETGHGLGLIKLPQAQSQPWLDAWQRQGNDADFDSLPFLLRVFCAQTQLSVSELARVEVDDILFLDQNHSQSAEFKVVIEGVGSTFAGYDKKQLTFSQALEYNMPNEPQFSDKIFTEADSYSDHGVSLGQEEREAENLADDDNLAQENQDVPVSEQSDQVQAEQSAAVGGNALDHLTVTLNFELANAAITLAQLKRLGPGYSFDLGLDFKAPIAIMVQGKCLGRCEIIEVDQRLGARVVEWHEGGEKK
ncbi:FliM/FliN family flagellar motor switch protein [Thalassomonas viridans]|uniref:FliM/FliN family flagellar motor switch protein n=1 Tax=Thalassomonas viridans TaxID=137584 RepID=A0AAF0CCR5_9GAMM|nr:FliM/FliN family flagellar motor switch protein [Thalassomonas viridans]WDE08638.1 FliM/FliN family flagellar motor switch protein [Thalassomonas viridans]